MKVEYSPELLELLCSKKKRNISIEVASSDHSDIEVTEIFLRYVTDEFADYLVQKKKYRAVTTEIGRILLPNYRLEYDDTIRFYLKKVWIFRKLEVEGVRL